MSATGLQVFDRTLQITNIWLNDITEQVGCDRKQAWAALGGVLRVLRDRLPANVAAHLADELPILVRGAYYDHYQPGRQPSAARHCEPFLEEIEDQLVGQKPLEVVEATRAVFQVLSRHISPGEVDKIRHALPEDIRRRLWPATAAESPPATTGEAPEGPEARP